MAKVTCITIGSYGPQVIVPTAKLGAIVEILNACQNVSSEWLEKDGDIEAHNVKVKGDMNLQITQIEANEVMTHEEYQAFRARIKEDNAMREREATTKIDKKAGTEVSK